MAAQMAGDCDLFDDWDVDPANCILELKIFVRQILIMGVYQFSTASDLRGATRLFLLSF